MDLENLKYKWQDMKYISLFENFAQDNAELKKAEKLLNATARVEYYVLDIKDRPKVYEKTVFVYVPGAKHPYKMMDRNTDMDPTEDEFVSLELGVIDSGVNKGKAYVQEGTMSTTDPQFIANLIEIERLDEKGLSSDAYDWIKELIDTSDDSWKSMITSAIKNNILNDKDYEILGIDKQNVRGMKRMSKYGV
jgi:hypothetical protein